MGLNRLEILGRIGRVDDLRQTGAGKDVLGLSVAVNERGSGEERTTWFKVAIFGKRAEALSRFLRKGELVYCAGPVSVDTWEDRDGKTRADLRMIAFDVELCGGGKDGGGQREERREQTSQRSASSEHDYAAGGGGGDFGDDDIPFAARDGRLP